MDKTVEMNVNSSSSMTHQLNNCDIKTEPVCKYLGVYVDSKQNDLFVPYRLCKNASSKTIRHYFKATVL